MSVEAARHHLRAWAEALRAQGEITWSAEEIIEHIERALSLIDIEIPESPRRGAPDLPDVIATHSIRAAYGPSKWRGDPETDQAWAHNLHSVTDLGRDDLAQAIGILASRVCLAQRAMHQTAEALISAVMGRHGLALPDVMLILAQAGRALEPKVWEALDRDSAD